MKFFIDTANLSQIKEANELGVLDGVTTNPSLMAKEGIAGNDNVLKHYMEICNIVDGDVSAEVISTEYNQIIKEGENLAALHENIVVKVPMIKDGVKAIKYFSNKGIKAKGIKPPKTIPYAADFKLGSKDAAIKSAITCATTTPNIPAI